MLYKTADGVPIQEGDYIFTRNCQYEVVKIYGCKGVLLYHSWKNCYNKVMHRHIFVSSDELKDGYYSLNYYCSGKLR